ncbi:sigma-70 family RNA polymerase sigma factor [Hyalangium rubrum]|uniref:Sigma-70 family RNA polymerase sigma factor n=1 Tax=Hyalangium rubrum TaxID=3103134 RepID=A0ABU5H2Z0_9BACT|nr:sigma-70 family RNA polymerase sigma factor [Hyalangium sp. s54d21]MDY7227158.1 sigma-70 family RNA polymerase sigma factor [Hyalangium sp. s54d21]
MAHAPSSPDLEAQATRAQETLPDIHADRAGFLRFLAERPEGLAHATDLYLAFACAQGVAPALAEFERRLEGVVGAAITHLRPSRVFVEEVHQRLRQRLLLAQEGALPKVLEYRGRGTLAHWLRAVALREALNLLAQQQARGAQEPLGAITELAAPGPDPELALLKRRYAPEFKGALEAALSNLPARERNFLRLFFIEGLTVEQIARMDGTHKSTVSRRMASARETVLQQMRLQLQERLALSVSELDSLVEQMRSQLDLSLARALD